MAYDYEVFRKIEITYRDDRLVWNLNKIKLLFHIETLGGGGLEVNLLGTRTRGPIVPTMGALTSAISTRHIPLHLARV